jgi:hypothetical protein
VASCRDAAERGAAAVVLDPGVSATGDPTERITPFLAASGNG